jgi:lipid II:glycine glycyltransferase (peptidoglycan interpeptide bridge formation enzyme)
MFSKYPEYFLQTKSWAKYWKKANLAGHEYFEFSSTNGLSGIVYQYPWQLGEKFWYVPKGPVAKSKMNISDLTREFKELVDCIIDQAKKQNVAFIKWDFDDSFCEQIGYQNNSALLQDLKILFPGQELRKSKKILQYLKAMVLEPKIETLDQNFGKYDIETLSSFFLDTKAFWSTTNENIRRYTKKSLNQGWRVNIDKTPQNFEAFWQVYQSTSERQKFSTHHKSNMKVLFEQDFSRLIVLYDPQNQPQAAWMGLVSEQTLTYLYGGNTQLSFAGYGQYLVHLVAIKMLVTEDLKYYDLGKYDELHSYSAFKKGYRGEIREFLGPVDIVLKPWKYKLINFLIGMRKLFSQSPN